ncbi:DUF6270 domain-containing protein [Paeniglutamicibacter sp. MACA_103]|uniref:DUF6270 domain-containing protein n=1 Tax=Paeniglutamicibacter sp. MACA_103 TaxID=3377337 RepID=UPI0038961C53
MKRVFIYGSCVTRDSEPWFNDFGFELAGYVARQSLISAFRPANLGEFDLSSIRSNFQRTMTQGDIEGNLRFAISRAEPEMIFWDLCDERLGVRPVTSGGMVTQSRDHVAQGLHSGPFGRQFRFGEDDHYALWERSLDEFLKVLARLELQNKTFLNATPWAIEDEFGSDHNGQSAKAESFNRKSERYLDLAWRKGINVVAAHHADAISRTQGHRWGPAPFHYVDASYIKMLERLSLAAE